MLYVESRYDALGARWGFPTRCNGKCFAHAEVSNALQYLGRQEEVGASNRHQLGLAPQGLGHFGPKLGLETQAEKLKFSKFPKCFHI
jgi:hypothetical protein